MSGKKINRPGYPPFTLTAGDWIMKGCILRTNERVAPLINAVWRRGRRGPTPEMGVDNETYRFVGTSAHSFDDFGFRVVE